MSKEMEGNPPVRGIGFELLAARIEELHGEVVQLVAERDRLRTLVQLIAADDWPGLLALAASWGVPTDHPSDYELEGDHSTDARYVYPSREALVYALARAALTGEAHAEP